MTTDAATLHVRCPKCDAQYLLPAHLLGPGGARVRCPACRDSFDVPPLNAEAVVAPSPDEVTPSVVPPQASAAAETPAASAALHATPPATSSPEPREVAGELPLKLEMATSEDAPAPPAQGPRETANKILGELAAREGEAIERAAREGRLFAEFGPVIFAAWDEYRKRATGGAASFREALRDRWGVDLPEVTPR